MTCLCRHRCRKQNPGAPEPQRCQIEPRRVALQHGVVELESDRKLVPMLVAHVVAARARAPAQEIQPIFRSGVKLRGR